MEARETLPEGHSCPVCGKEVSSEIRSAECQIRHIEVQIDVQSRRLTGAERAELQTRKVVLQARVLSLKEGIPQDLAEARIRYDAAWMGMGSLRHNLIVYDDVQSHGVEASPEVLRALGERVFETGKEVRRLEALYGINPPEIVVPEPPKKRWWRR